MNYFIYTLSLDTEVQYVGQTYRPELRKAEHASKYPHLTFEIVQTISSRLLFQMHGKVSKAIVQIEQAWINRLRPPMNYTYFTTTWDGCSRFVP